MGTQVTHPLVGDTVRLLIADGYFSRFSKGEIRYVLKVDPKDKSFQLATTPDSDDGLWAYFHETEGLSKDPYQVGGNHYSKHSIEPFDIMKDWKLGAVRLKVLKYLLRAPEKNGKEDIEKAKGCIQYLLDNYEDLETKGIL